MKIEPTICEDGTNFYTGLFDAGVPMDRLKTAIYNPDTNTCTANNGGDLIDGLVYGFTVIPLPEPEPEPVEGEEALTPPQLIKFETLDELEQIIVFLDGRKWTPSKTYAKDIDVKKFIKLIKRRKIQLKLAIISDDADVDRTDINPYRKRANSKETWLLSFDREMSLSEFKTGIPTGRTDTLHEQLNDLGLEVDCDSDGYDGWVFYISCDSEEAQQYLCRSLLHLGLKILWNGNH